MGSKWQPECHCFLGTILHLYSIKCLPVMTILHDTPTRSNDWLSPPRDCPSPYKTIYESTQHYVLCPVNRSSNELSLPMGKIIRAGMFSQQLKRVEQSLQQKEPTLVNCKGILFYYDNDRPYVARVFRDTIQWFRWKTLFHSPYWPEITSFH